MTPRCLLPVTARHAETRPGPLTHITFRSPATEG